MTELLSGTRVIWKSSLSRWTLSRSVQRRSKVHKLWSHRSSKVRRTWKSIKTALPLLYKISPFRITLPAFTRARQVPRGHVWLEGDNTLQSLDSRSYGPVPISHLEYKVFLRVWPLSHFGRLQTPKPATCTTDEPCDPAFVQRGLK
ncbi:IMP1 inner mitochondrial membrane peptidase-like [Schistosoma haematobium]|uniref:IMP1 inner mitochondrial membrane peptidase-like n=1 Tax=Schistosoma haematobium TaxID=6185 RepID=A0A922LJB3_SCHHA|nr:IMP1 inner mitochondrial membrane peptidase-like [Schistosoma haematobium]KAH9587321.1 IMP1 inner mitochondrial membrane peptidase-like [Schistosoma haematobium]